LATEPSPQRAYRAPCPNCGAEVEFRSAASAFAVCSFCRSTIVRDGDALRRIGQSAELFDDHSPLQLGASGRVQGAGFTLVGRLQYRYAEGTWNEWHALFDNGRSGWLSEDNGRYVLAFDQPLQAAVPEAASLRPGQQQIVNGQPWSVASVSAAKLIAAQGELPVKPNTERGFVVSDLRSTRDEVGTLDYSDPAAPKWSVGRSVAISELAMTGLAEQAQKTLKARSIECPNCGTSLEVKLATTQSIVCHQCHSVVDVSQGVGGDLAHYVQDNGSEPQIALGSVGTLALGGKAPLPWQVVGYVERCELPDGSDDEQTFWREYLLYHRTEGFAFIVDAEDGWSWTAPITGVPQLRGDSAVYQGATYRKLYTYTGQVTYVLGEFYWQLTREQRTLNTDYQSGSKRLNREQTGDEIVWSAGDAMSADDVMKAFRLAGDRRAALQRDVLPSSGSGGLLAKLFVAMFVIAVLLMLFRCSSGSSSSNCDGLRTTYGENSQEYASCLNSNRSGGGSGFRTGGGSFGGFSSGGGHK
jgi:Zn finger protein HypA/HybF involved in hydrogenase expression